MTHPITMTYRNWRGEIAEREIAPISIWFGHTDWHTEPQWLLRAMDIEKDAERDFALADCQFADLRVPAPAVPDDVSEQVAELRSAKPDEHCNDSKCKDAADTIEALAASVDRANAANEALCADVEAQAAELARLRGFAEFVTRWAVSFRTSDRDDTVWTTDQWRELRRQIAALTHPTGGSND